MTRDEAEFRRLTRAAVNAERRAAIGSTIEREYRRFVDGRYFEQFLAEIRAAVERSVIGGDVGGAANVSDHIIQHDGGITDIGGVAADAIGQSGIDGFGGGASEGAVNDSDVSDKQAAEMASDGVEPDYLSLDHIKSYLGRFIHSKNPFFDEFSEHMAARLRGHRLSGDAK